MLNKSDDITANPFALMMNPEAVVAAMNHSARLSRLKSRICRPLDKPAQVNDRSASTASDDEAADDSNQIDE